ncbi:MAG: TonB-dependent receptor plug domain-containing protein [Gammaproteobacteria bacterium]|nr:TonB-dependent receptor plug domain-containing protein [Gammaproteobacteria bacterium]
MANPLHTKFSRIIWVCMSIAMCPIPFVSVQAQVIEEIIVTARKREESLQDTPISIQAFTADGLEKRGIDNLSEIGSFTPNMTFDKAATIGGSNNAAIVYIRGIGQDAAIPTIDLGVGTYVDGVYLARSVGGSLDLVDVERIEVLRGPQGTLFGRNTIGGAINITTKKPNEEFRADASLTYGSDDMINGKFTLNGGITENLFAKGTVISKNRDGYVIRPDGTDLGDDDMLAGNVALRWLVSDSVTVDFAVDVTAVIPMARRLHRLMCKPMQLFHSFTMLFSDHRLMVASYHRHLVPVAPTVPTPLASMDNGYRLTEILNLAQCQPRMSLMCWVWPELLSGK